MKRMYGKFKKFDTKFWSENVKEREQLKKKVCNSEGNIKMVLKVRCKPVNFHLADRKSACEQTDFSTKFLNYALKF